MSARWWANVLALFLLCLLFWLGLITLCLMLWKAVRP